MEIIKMDLEFENDSLSNLKRHLEELIYSKTKKEICLEFDRVPSNKYFKKIIELFIDYKVAFLKMIKYAKKKEDKVMKRTFHNGEEAKLNSHQIILGDVHSGAHLLVEGNIVIIGDIKGDITLTNDGASVFATSFTNAKIHHAHGLVSLINGQNKLVNVEEIGGKVWHE